ncbi:MAG: hypothetical protein F4Y80_07385 [Caldilineaceae bacterium SB0665_bin_21]|nr:hypothetical protein [Caldilineaceae bacterium SB0665_bin_21]
MNVQIRDRSALLSLSITSLRAYLHSRNWEALGQWGQRPATVYAKEHDGRTWEIIVPHRDTIGGYAAGMAEAVAVLAVVEDRSQLDVFHDLVGTGADVIRLSSMNGSAKVPLSLRQSTEFLNDSYNLLAAAARSAERARATHRGPLSANVAEFLGHVRPLPGYYEGYELTLHSPVPVGLGTQLDLGDDFHPPFPRQATLKLVEALAYSSVAITKAMSEDPLEYLHQAVPYGVSANLCDAVAELARKGEGVEIGVTWAEVRAQSKHSSSAAIFQFSQHSADILDEAARFFRINDPFLDESVVAQIVQLEREPEEFDGRATILYVREGRPIRMQAEFSKETYDTELFYLSY